jgi:tetratricopeptide (TPR) repeat protein
VVGTADYLAPERVRGEWDDERAEVYSLGVILFELSTLRLPFISSGRTTSHDHLSLIAPLASHFAEVPAAWDALLRDCLAKEPARRPASVAALLQRLQGDLGPCRRATPDLEVAAPRSLSAGAEPAAILVASAANLLHVIEAVESERGFVARVQGERLIAVFAAVDCDAPLEAARRVGVLLRARGLTPALALHVDAVTIGRASDGARTAHGLALDNPETWLPPAESEPVYVSQAAALGLHCSSVRDLASGLAGSPRKEPDATEQHLHEFGDALPLFGRGDVVLAVEASLERWRRGGGPAVCVCLSEPRAGKTRMAEECLRLARTVASADAVLLRGERGSGGLFRVSDALAAFESTQAVTSEPWRLQAILERRAAARPLALIIDDSHLLEDELLEALEALLLARPALPIWVMALADRRFAKTQSLWGRRLTSFQTLELDRLGAEPAMALCRQLLLPAEYVPQAALSRICEAAANLPGVLLDLTREIHRAGLVRQRPGQQTFFLDTAELPALPASTFWHWVAARELHSLEPALVAALKVAAILGPGVYLEELEWTQRALLEAKAPFEVMDATAIVRRLLERGLLRPSVQPGGPYLFRAAALADAIAASVEVDDRRMIHRLALAFHQSRQQAAESRLIAMARHASALSERELATAAHRELAERAASAQRVVDAEAHFSAALGFCDRAELRAELLLGRASAHYRMYRLTDAQSDLSESIEIARQSGKRRLEAAAGFELATVLDWAGDYAASAEVGARAASLAATLAHPGLGARALVASGRAHWRAGRVAAAVDSLSAAVEACDREGELDGSIIGRLLLGCAQVLLGQRIEAAACFERVLALAESSGDGLHCCAALGNRAFLWVVENDVNRCLEDLTRAVTTARKLGHPGTERTALLNLAEVLYWAGREDEALSWLTQARLLEDRFLQRPVHSAMLLLARIRLLKGEYDDARAALAWLSERRLPQANAANALAFQSALVHVLRARLAQGGPEPSPALPPLDWDAISALQQEFLLDERIELQFWRFNCQWEEGASPDERALLLEHAPRSLTEHPVWGARARALSAARPR